MKIISHTVKPKIPPALSSLEEMAHNLWLSWNFEAITLFMRLDYDVWLQSNQNPAMMLGMVAQERYDELAQDDSYIAALKMVEEKFSATRTASPGTRASMTESWPISRWSTGSMSPFRRIRGDWASSPATI